MAIACTPLIIRVNRPFSAQVLKLPLSGADNGSIITDLSSFQHPFSRVGDARTRSSAYKFYGSSAYFGGAGDYFYTPCTSDLLIRAGAFSVSVYVLPLSASDSQIIIGSTSNIYGVQYEYLIIFSTTAALFYYGVRGSSQSWVRLIWQSPVAINEFHHFVMQRDLDGSWYAAINGVPALTYQFSNSSSGVSYGPVTDLPFVNSVDLGASLSNPLTIGGAWLGSMYGYLQDLSMWVGEAPFAGTFTPPGSLVV